MKKPDLPSGDGNQPRWHCQSALSGQFARAEIKAIYAENPGRQAQLEVEGGCRFLQPCICTASHLAEQHGARRSSALLDDRRPIPSMKDSTNLRAEENENRNLPRRRLQPDGCAANPTIAAAIATIRNEMAHTNI